jgi:esterase
MPSPTLNTTLLRAQASEPTRVVAFLHGILGTGGNLRGLAQAFVQADPTLGALLIDLRLHGKSRGFAPPHDVAACARDLLALESTLALPIVGVVAHSFGGKVALAYHAQRPRLERVVLLDSDPGRRPDRVGSEQTMAVIAMLERLPKLYPKREDFVELVHGEGHSRAIADWLAMNLERTPEGLAFRVDLAGIRALLDSYFASDLWPVLEGSSARIDVVIGGRSRVWDEAHLARINQLASEQPERVFAHVLAEAGHWVHAEDPHGLRRALGLNSDA